METAVSVMETVETVEMSLEDRMAAAALKILMMMRRKKSLRVLCRRFDEARCPTIEGVGNME